jgi:methanogenic corrinoid protein MtbC1
MTPDPSLFALVAASHGNKLFQQTADTFNLLSGQIEATLLRYELDAHLFLGVHSFSEFELYAGAISDLTRTCQKITVFGEADARPRPLPKTEFIALPADATLTRERFIIVNHPRWQVMVLAQTLPETSDRRARQRRYQSLLTFAAPTIERGSMIASMLAGQTAAPVGRADIAAQQQHIAHFAVRLATLTGRLGVELGQMLGEVPRLADLAAQVARPSSLDEQIGAVTQIARELLKAQALTVYRHEGMMLRPVVSSAPLGTLKGVVSGLGAVGRAAETRAVVEMSAAESGTNEIAGTDTILALPLMAQRELWGVASFALSRPLNTPQERGLVMALVGMIDALIAEDSAPAAPPAVMPPRMTTTATVTLTPTPSAPISATRTTTPAPAVPPLTMPTVEPLEFPSLDSSPEPAYTPPARQPSATGRGRIRLSPTRAVENTTTAPAAAPALELARLPEVQPAEPEIEDPFADFQRRMISYLLAFDRDGADRVWREAYAKFPARELILNLLQPVMVAVGEGWHRGQVSVAAEHFSTSYVESKIIGFLNSYPDNPEGAVVLTGCVQGELHATGAMIFSLFLRWQGYRVIYLGANVPNSTIADALYEIKPDMLCLSATMKENANNMTEVGHIIARLTEPRPAFGFGGSAFIFFPEMRERVMGTYLGDDPIYRAEHGQSIGERASGDLAAAAQRQKVSRA